MTSHHSVQVKKKIRKRSYFTRLKDGAWTKLVCSLPQAANYLGSPCQANPVQQETIPDAGD
jgi:hypothetical protein